jgi:hypothetical protein
MGQRFLLLILFWITSIYAGFGQSTDASIAGRVVDEKGETLPGVVVVVRNEATGFQTSTVTGVDGRYRLRQLPLGRPYTVRASFVGSGTQVKNDLALNLGDQLAVDFTLAPASVGLTEVVVKGNALNSRIDRLGSSTAITDQTIREIPVLNRSFTSLKCLLTCTM